MNNGEWVSGLGYPSSEDPYRRECAALRARRQAPRRQLVMVLVTEGPARLAGPVLAERFAGVRVETGSVLVPITGETNPEDVTAYCRERRIGVVASCVAAQPPEVSA